MANKSIKTYREKTGKSCFCCGEKAGYFSVKEVGPGEASKRVYHCQSCRAEARQEVERS